MARRATDVGRAAFINRNFGLVWSAQTISVVGDMTFDTALVLWVASFLTKGQSWSPLAVSYVLLAALIPQIVAAPIAGVFVDRWNKRHTMLIVNGLQAIFVTSLILVTGYISLPFGGGTHLPTSWRLGATYFDVVLIAVLAQFFLPAQFALIKDIVHEDKQDQALETSQASQGLSIIVGPALGALLVFSAGIQWALVLDAASFGISFLLILAVKAPPAASSLAPGTTGHFTSEFLAGFRYVLGHRVLHTILVSVVLVWLGFGALQSLGYFFITENLHVPASYYGIFGTVFGVGAIVGALLVTLIGQRVGLARMLWIALVTSGVFVIVMSHLNSFYPALGAACLFGISATAIIVTASPLAIHSSAREFVGRVTTVINPIGQLAALTSIIVAGYLVSTVLNGFHATLFGLITFNRVNVVFTGMGLLAAAGGLYARVNFRGIIRQADRERAGGKLAAEDETPEHRADRRPPRAGPSEDVPSHGAMSS